jgi:YegS/Rv2252/BmrU family lipid kinase
VYHIIFNPKAHSGKSGAVLEKVETRLRSEQVEYTIHETLYAGHARELANELSQTEETIIVVGGDGTLHEAVNGLADPQKTALAIIPAGTGNDFCTAAGITDADKVMDRLFRGETKETDYITADGNRSLNAGGMGIDVDVLERTARSRIKGKIKYLFSLIASVMSFRGYRVRVHINGEILNEKAFIVAICNGSDIGGGIRICPDACIDDGKMELVIVRYKNFFGTIKTFIRLLQGKILNSPQTLHYYCDEVEIMPDRARTVQLDGELYEGNSVFRAKIEKGLKIYR